MAKLFFRYAAMNAGKSTALLQVAHNYEEQGQVVQLYTAAIDNRYGVGRITFNRPQARNALTFAMYERLAAICEEVETKKDVKVLLLTGAGDKAFASGTDISQFRAFKEPKDALEYEARIDRVLGTLEKCPIPTIAAISGACTGGGAGIAACCDLRVATKTSDRKSTRLNSSHT